MWFSRTLSLFQLVALFSFLGRDHLSQADTHFLYMTNYCSKYLLVDTSLLLSLTAPENLPDNRDIDFVHCDLELLAPRGMKLVMHFLQLAISPLADHSDRLHLFDMTTNQTRLTPNRGLYGRLDRALSIYDDSGTRIDDYRSIGNKMKVDYLGKPTKMSSGFRLLVTPFQDPSYNGKCPDRFYLCSGASICIDRQLACDGSPNCGKDDPGDEKGCDRYDTVTNLLAEYSLTKDIILVILFPLGVFIGVVIIIFYMAKVCIRKRINQPEVPTVHFTPKKEGQVRIAEDAGIYAPPPYECILNLSASYDPPPAYSRVSKREVGEEKVTDLMEETIEASEAEERGTRCKENTSLPIKIEVHSMLYVDDEDECLTDGPRASEYESYRLHCLYPSDTDEDEEIKARRRRKGGRVKGRKKDKVDNYQKSSTPETSSVPSSDSPRVTPESSSLNVSPLYCPQVPESPQESSTQVTSRGSHEHSNNSISHNCKSDFTSAFAVTPAKTSYCSKSGDTFDVGADCAVNETHKQAASRKFSHDSHKEDNCMSSNEQSADNSKTRSHNQKPEIVLAKMDDELEPDSGRCHFLLSKDEITLNKSKNHIANGHTSIFTKGVSRNAAKI